MVNTDEKGSSEPEEAKGKGEIMRYKMVKPKMDTSLQHRIRRTLVAAGYSKDQILMGHTPQGVYIRSLDEVLLKQMAVALCGSTLLGTTEVIPTYDRGMHYYVVKELTPWPGTKAR